MESSDLSLLEISEEDDSLLQQSPIDESSNLNHYLSCSPLVRSRFSPLVRIKTDQNEARGSGLPPQNKVKNENSGASSSDVPNLCNEPQQMKRRKKGGGYNLRKSIAWNKAFFTEEGVLDSSELSMISGALCSIQEEESNSLTKTTGSIRNKGNGSLFTSKCDSSPRDKGASTSATPRKVLSVHDGNRNRCSPGGSSSVLASSSNKRPPIGRITRAVAKESKLPKFPVLKPDTKSVSAATRSTTNSNPVARRALNVQKDVGFKASSSSRKIVEADIKRRTVLRSLPAKAPVTSYRKDPSKSTRPIPLSRDVQPQKKSKANSTPGLTRDPVLPAAAATHASNIHQISTISEITSHQNPDDNNGNEQSERSQACKPSSLRMPSPSLGFFGQAKASGKQVLSGKGALSCKAQESGIPKVQKLASKVPDPKVKPPRAPAKANKFIKENSPVKSLCTTSSVPSAMKVVSQNNLKLKLDLQMVDNPPTISNDTCDDAVNWLGVSKANVVHEDQQTGYKNYNSSAVDYAAIAEAQLETTSDTTFNDQGVHGLNVRTAYDDHDQSELTKSCFGEDNQIPFVRNQGTGTSDSFSLQENRLSEASLKIDLEEVSSKDLVVGKSDSRTFDGLPRYVGQEKESTEIDMSSVKLSGASARVESIDCNLLADSCSRELSTFTVGNPQILVGSVNENTGEPLQPTNPCVNEKDIQELHSSDLHGSEFKSVHITSQFTVDTQVDGNCESNCSSDQLQSKDNGHNSLVNSECVLSESQFVDMSSSSCQDALIPMCDGMPCVDKESVDQGEFSKACDSGTCKSIQVENPDVQEGNEFVIVKDRSFAEFKKRSIGNVTDANPYVQASIAGEVDISQPFSQLECIYQENGEPAKVHDITDESHLVDNSLDQHDSQKSLDDSREYGKKLEVEFSCIVDESKAEHIDVDRNEFVVLNCGNASETEANSADPLSSVRPETNDAGAINNENITGRLSLVGDLPESESLVEGHTMVTDNVADVNPQVEADNSPLFSQHECIDEANEEPNKTHEITDQSHLVDAEESSLHNQILEDYTSNLTSSLDYDSLKCLDDYKQSEKNFESACNVDELKEEQIDVDGSEFVVLKCGHASDTEVKGAGHLSSVPQEMSDASVINFVRDETSLLVGNQPESEPLVEDHSFVTDTPIWNSYELKNGATVTAENLEQFHSLDEEPELMIQSSSRKAQSDSNLIDDREGQEMQNNNDGLFKETGSVEELQKDNGDDIEDAGLDNSCSTVDQEIECAGDEQVEYLDYNLITESFQCKQMSTAVISQLKGAIDDAKEDCGQVSINSAQVSCSSPTKHDLQLSLDQSISVINFARDETSSLVGNQPESEPLVEDHSFVTDTPIWNSFELKNGATVTAENLEQFHSLDEEPELMIQTSTRIAQSDSNLIDDREGQELQNNNDSLFKKTGSVEELQKDNGDDIEDAGLDNSCSSVDQAIECAGDKQVEYLDYNLITESFQCKQISTAVISQLKGAIDDAKEDCGQVSINSAQVSCSSPTKHDLQLSLDQSTSVINFVRDETSSLVGNQPESEPLVEDHSFVTDTPIWNSFELKNGATVTAENLEQFHSLDEEPELMIQSSTRIAQSDSNLIDDREGQELQNNNDGLFKETGSVEELQKDNGDDIEDAGLDNSCSTMDQEIECAGDEQVEYLDYNLITESFQCKQISTTVISQLKGAIDDAKEDRGQVSINSAQVSCSSPTKHDLQLSLDQSTGAHSNKSLLVDGEIQMSDSSNAEPTNLHDLITATKDKDETTQRSDSKNEMKGDGPVINLPLNAVPFSDEWLAAMEAAGEDILAQKTGAVQHSPTEKPIAEPGPWSPVKKKKNHEIGPFDCTKYTNTEPSDSN